MIWISLTLDKIKKEILSQHNNFSNNVLLALKKKHT